MQEKHVAPSLSGAIVKESKIKHSVLGECERVGAASDRTKSRGGARTPLSRVPETGRTLETRRGSEKNNTGTVVRARSRGVTPGSWVLKKEGVAEGGSGRRSPGKARPFSVNSSSVETQIKKPSLSLDGPKILGGTCRRGQSGTAGEVFLYDRG